MFIDLSQLVQVLIEDSKFELLLAIMIQCCSEMVTNLCESSLITVVDMFSLCSVIQKKQVHVTLVATVG